MKKPSIWSAVSVEPAVFSYSFVSFIYVVVIQNLIQQKVCSPAAEPPLRFICNDTTLLATATDIATTRSILREALPAMVLLLAGFWRDASNLNKPILHFALIGEIIGVSIELFSFLNWKTSPWATSISDALITGLTGNNKLFSIGATCVITDISHPEDRSARLTLIIGAMAAGACLATAISGYCLTFFGYKWFLMLVIGLYLFTICLVVIFVKENKKTARKGNKLETIINLKSAFKPRPNITVIWLMIICSCLLNSSATGEYNVLLYYLEQGFGFTVEEAGVYQSYRLMINVVSSIAMPSIFTKFLKWSDLKSGMVSAIFTLTATILMIVAKTKLELALFTLLDIMKLFLYTVPKSVITKCVRDGEIGVYLSYCYIGECILPIGMLYVYDYIFSATAKILPGAFYSASSAVIMLALVFFSVAACIYVSPKNESSEECKTTNYLEKCDSQLDRQSELADKY